MNKNALIKLMVIGLVFLVLGCAGTRPDITVENESVLPGSKVTFKGNEHKLLGDPILVGQKLFQTSVVDSKNLKEVDLSQETGQVLFISVVPSVDTKVCEEQTHLLGEQGDKLPKNIRRITISRDTPFAQNRFAEEADLTDIEYYSDYKSGQFGKSAGLLVDDLMLLARSVILVDRDGVIRYIQVVPEMTHLPDMEKAFDLAVELSATTM